MTTTGASPDRLRRLADGLGDMSDDLDPRREPLRQALDAFRGSPGWRDWLDAVPPYDIDLGVDVTRIGRLSAFVEGVATGLEAADSGDGVLTADDSAIASHVPPLQPDADIQVVGDQVVINGTDEDDHIRITTVLGLPVVEVLDEDGNVVATQLLTREQQENLVIRGGDGDDVLEVDPSYILDITVLGGRGDDVVGRRGEDESFLLGGGGDDRIYGGDGDDRLAGGAGSDSIYGGDGLDAIDGQADNDLLSGGDGDDAIYTGAGNDLVWGGTGRRAPPGCWSTSCPTPTTPSPTTGPTGRRPRPPATRSWRSRNATTMAPRCSTATATRSPTPTSASPTGRPPRWPRSTRSASTSTATAPPTSPATTPTASTRTPSATSSAGPAATTTDLRAPSAQGAVLAFSETTWDEPPGAMVTP